MACEFKGEEYHKGRMDVEHVRDFCTLNYLGCLIDDPMGYLTCTRRAFALLQRCDPGETPMDTRRKPKKTPGASQTSML
jgi:hypothetical protein